MTTNSLSPLSNNAGCVFCLTLDERHTHTHTTSATVSTLATYIDELTLQQKITTKQQKVNKQKSPVHWSRQEVTLLVQLLSRYGSDFSLIGCQMGKSRQQVKRKFKALEKKNPNLALSIFDRQSTCNSPVLTLQTDEFLDCN